MQPSPALFPFDALITLPQDWLAASWSSVRFRRTVLLRLLDQMRFFGVGRVWVRGGDAGPAAAWLALQSGCDVAPWLPEWEASPAANLNSRKGALLLLRGDLVTGAEPLGNLLIRVQQDSSFGGGLWAGDASGGVSVLVQAVPEGETRGVAGGTAAEEGLLQVEGEGWQKLGAGSCFDLREEAGRSAWRRNLYRELGRSSDGPVARSLNRPLSARLTPFLARLGISPDGMTGFLLLLGLANAWNIWWNGAKGLLPSGFLLLFLSVLEGCDGELARLRFRCTRSGAWFARLSGVLQTGLTMGALLHVRYREAPGMGALLGLLFFVLLYLVIIYTLVRFYRSSPGRVPYEAIGPALQKMRSGQAQGWERMTLPLQALVKPDVVALGLALMALLGMPAVAFWVVLAAVAGMSLTLVRARRFQVGKELKSSSFFFYLLGLGLLALLFMTLPFPALRESFVSMGWRLGWVFLCPIPWTLVNTLALKTLLPVRVPFLSLLYNQLTGEAYNMILPLAGLGGEAYKVRHLVSWMPVAQAGRAILRDRLVHVLANFLYTGIAAGFTACAVPLALEFRLALGGIALLLVALAMLLFWLLATDRAGSALAWMLRRFRFLNEYRRDRMPLSVLMPSVGYKVMGRALYLVEISTIFLLLGIEVEIGRLIAVSAMIALSSTLFFVVPQGMGVNEAGISGAFALLGLVAHEGLVFGLIRRARIVVWALLGVLLHLMAMGLRRVLPRRGQDRQGAL